MKKPANSKASAHVTGAALARHIAMSPQMISRLVKAGIVAAEPDGKFDLDACRINYIQHLRSHRNQKADGDRAFRALKSQKLQMEIDKAAGRLIDLDEALLFSEHLIAQFRRGLDGMAARCSRDRAVREAIDAAVFEILTELSDDAAKKAALLRAGESLIEKEVEDADTTIDEAEAEDDDTPAH